MGKSLVYPTSTTQEAPGQSFHQELKALFKDNREKGSILQTSTTASSVLSGVAEFLRECGNLYRTLEALDTEGTGKVTGHTWKLGLELLGWTGDAGQAWKMLDRQGVDQLTPKQIEQQLMSYLP